MGTTALWHRGWHRPLYWLASSPGISPASARHFNNLNAARRAKHQPDRAGSGRIPARRLSRSVALQVLQNPLAVAPLVLQTTLQHVPRVSLQPFEVDGTLVRRVGVSL